MHYITKQQLIVICYSENINTAKNYDNQTGTNKRCKKI